MNVRELMQELGSMDPEAEVLFAYNYGDYWHTTVAQPVESVQLKAVRHSNYHRMDKLVGEEEDELRDGDRKVVCLL